MHSLYGNFHASHLFITKCRIYDSDGRLLYYCDQRKLDWYIHQDLAELIEDDPPAVKLIFEPKGCPKDEKNEF